MAQSSDDDEREPRRVAFQILIVSRADSDAGRYVVDVAEHLYATMDDARHAAQRAARQEARRRQVAVDSVRWDVDRTVLPRVLSRYMVKHLLQGYCSVPLSQQTSSSAAAARTYEQCDYYVVLQVRGPPSWDDGCGEYPDSGSGSGDAISPEPAAPPPPPPAKQPRAAPQHVDLTAEHGTVADNAALAAASSSVQEPRTLAQTVKHDIAKSRASLRALVNKVAAEQKAAIAAERRRQQRKRRREEAEATASGH